MTRKCEFTGCKHEAKWEAVKHFGKGGSIFTCDEHKPGSLMGKLKELSLGRELPSFYFVKPIGDPK